MLRWARVPHVGPQTTSMRPIACKFLRARVIGCQNRLPTRSLRCCLIILVRVIGQENKTRRFCRCQNLFSQLGDFAVGFFWPSVGGSDQRKSALDAYIAQRRSAPPSRAPDEGTRS